MSLADMEVERIIEESERHYRSLIENSSDVIIQLDKNALILYTSPSINNIFGYNEYELIGESYYRLYSSQV